MIKALIFDIGGVILHVTDDSAVALWQEHFNMPKQDLFALLFGSELSTKAMVGDVPESAVWQHVSTSLNLVPEQLERFHEAFWTNERLNHELLAFIAKLRSDYKVIFLSNVWSDARQTFNQKYGFDSLVDDIIYSAEVRLAKPDPRIYELALNQLGIEPHEAIFVDDNIKNIQAAKTLGLHAVQFETTVQVIADIKELLGMQNKTQVSVAQALAWLPGPKGERFSEVLTHGTLAIEIYAPRGIDHQTPHTRDEVYIIVSGKGTFLNGEERQPFGAGDVLFVSAGVIHRFEDFSDDFVTWVIFYGPEGGESIRAGFREVRERQHN